MYIEKVSILLKNRTILSNLVLQSKVENENSNGLVNEARKRGLYAGRMAGSHTKFDVVIVNFKKKKIEFIQVKNKKVYGKEKKKLEELSKLNDEYVVEFKAVTK